MTLALSDYLVLFFLWSIVAVLPLTYFLFGDAWLSSFVGAEVGGAFWLGFVYWREE